MKITNTAIKNQIQVSLGTLTKGDCFYLEGSVWVFSKYNESGEVTVVCLDNGMICHLSAEIMVGLVKDVELLYSHQIRKTSDVSRSDKFRVARLYGQPTPAQGEMK